MGSRTPKPELVFGLAQTIICKYLQLKFPYIYFEKLFEFFFIRNVSKPLNHRDPATNNVAEIRAVTEAIKIAKNYGIFFCLIILKLN